MRYRPAKDKATPLALVILDGWGLSDSFEGNAIAQAKTPNTDKISREYGCVSICASGRCVGLKHGTMGNSEVGHLILGSGRIVYQDMPRISNAISNGSFFTNPELVRFLRSIEREKNAIHLIGLVSNGGVHSDMTHLYALLKMIKRFRITEVFIHAILDGRDTPPKSATHFLGILQRFLKSHQVSRIATIAGRYYAMDRDNRWNRTSREYRAIVDAVGPVGRDPIELVSNYYERGVTDEFIPPSIVLPRTRIKDGDGVLFFNFRPDRARQLTEALVTHRFSGFQRKRFPKIKFLSMTEYRDKLNTPVIFERKTVANTLGEILAREGFRQVRIAETEKYAQVTYFFNGLKEDALPHEHRILVPSPKVSTYDLKPEMSAHGVASELCKQIESNKYEFILGNFANPDMVGHTGNLAATIQAVETVDECVGRVVQSCHSVGCNLIVTADHGNAECMIDLATHQPHTAHTSNPVPFIPMINQLKFDRRKRGGLSDIATTVLRLFDIKAPREMTGRQLLH